MCPGSPAASLRGTSVPPLPSGRPSSLGGFLLPASLSPTIPSCLPGRLWGPLVAPDLHAPPVGGPSRCSLRPFSLPWPRDVPRLSAPPCLCPCRLVFSFFWAPRAVFPGLSPLPGPPRPSSWCARGRSDSLGSATALGVCFFLAFGTPWVPWLECRSPLPRLLPAGFVPCLPPSPAGPLFGFVVLSRPPLRPCFLLCGLSRASPLVSPSVFPPFIIIIEMRNSLF